MVRLTCLLARKPGTTYDEFLAYWRDVHAPLVLGLEGGRYVLRYEQHPRPRSDYPEDAAGGERRPTTGSSYDGVTVQWFATMDDYLASVAAPDAHLVFEDLEKFLDTSRLEFIVTEEPMVPRDGPGGTAV